MDSRQAHVIYEFGEFQLDALRRVLSPREAGQPLQLTGRTFDALLYFVERPGQLLDKRTLMEALWPNVVVEESNLTQTIHTLRRTLGERPDDHRYIVTVPGRGYRFVADVATRAVSQAVAAGPALATTQTRATPETPPTTQTAANAQTPANGIETAARAQAQTTRWKLLAIATLSLPILAAALVFFLRGPGDTRETPTASATPSIAVLPFVDMSPEHNQAYFSEGLSEEILHLLAQSPTLRVIARTSSFSFKGGSADIATIAARLNVTHVLEGSVRKSGERVRITAQLVDAATSTHVWSKTYDRDAKDILGVQTDIAAAVAKSMRVTFAAGDRPKLGETTNPAAFENYLQGKYFFNRRATGDLRLALQYFERALQIDPGYARAWAGLAGAYYVEPRGNGPMSGETRSKWREAIQRALALNPDLAEANVRAAQFYWSEGETAVAREHYERAVSSDPSDPLVMSTSAGAALMQGRLDEAIALQRRVVAVDPLSATGHGNLASFLMAAGQWENAKAEFSEAIELNPASFDRKAEIVKILIRQRRFEEARLLGEQLPEGYLRDQCLALALHGLGEHAAANAALERLLSRPAPPDGTVKLAVAEVYAARADHDEAFQWLAQAAEETRAVGASMPGWWMKENLQLSPFLQLLRSDPRFQELLARVEQH